MEKTVPAPARRAAKHPQAGEHEVDVCLATATTAKVLHYNHSVKPWMAAALPEWVCGDVPVPLLRLWHDAWMDYLSTMHLRFSVIFEPAAGCWPAWRSHAR